MNKKNREMLNNADEFTLKRWSALIDGVNMIMDHGEKKGIDPEKITFKQSSLLNFIEERTEKIKIIH